jgi:hypothetical protein
LRQPARFNILLAVPVALLAALGVASIKRWRWTAVPLALLILAEYLALPFPHTAVHTPAWFTQLAQEEGDFAIWNMPFHLYSYNKAYMFQQVTHGQPIVNGKVARVPREALAFVQSTPFLDELYHNQLNPQQIDVSHQLQTLAAAHVRYIVIHKAFVSPTELAQWRDWFAIPPTHEDEELVVYGTDLQNGRDFTPVDTLTNEIHLVTATILADTTSTQGLVQVNAVWTATAVPATDNNLCLQLQQGSHIAYRHCTPIAPTWPTSQWQANEVVRGHYAFQLDGSLDAGDYDVVLQLVDDEATAVGSPAPIGQLSLYPLDLPVQWADLITLQEVALTSTPESLELSLHWQALQKMDTSYKIFVHLLDATTGELVAQIDTFPVGWTYLTNAWQVGEQVEDHISLPLVDALPGQYQVVIGFYDEATGERLSAPFANDGVPLTYYGR